MSQWVLKLIKWHPTPDEVVEAGVEIVAEIPYVTERRGPERLSTMPEAASLGRQIRTLDWLCRWSQRIFFGSKNASIGPEVGSGTESKTQRPLLS
ncbi:hypothetical protein GGP46_002022 [Salinibacter ruber]|nr:hypothetical protein [Salinibacter ruber]